MNAVGNGAGAFGYVNGSNSLVFANGFGSLNWVYLTGNGNQSTTDGLGAVNFGYSRDGAIASSIGDGAFNHFYLRDTGSESRSTGSGSFLHSNLKGGSKASVIGESVLFTRDTIGGTSTISGDNSYNFGSRITNSSDNSFAFGTDIGGIAQNSAVFGWGGVVGAVITQFGIQIPSQGGINPQLAYFDNGGNFFSSADLPYLPAVHAVKAASISTFTANTAPSNATIGTWQYTGSGGNTFTLPNLLGGPNDDGSIFDIKHAGSGILNIAAAAGTSIFAERAGMNSQILFIGDHVRYVFNGTIWHASEIQWERGYVAKTSVYTAQIYDRVIDCTSGTFNVTAFTAASNKGKILTIKNSGAGVITVLSTGAQTFDGAVNITLVSKQSATIMSNNANWIII